VFVTLHGPRRLYFVRKLNLLCLTDLILNLIGMLNFLNFYILNFCDTDLHEASKICNLNYIVTF
jgi:hypothetical protein